MYTILLKEDDMLNEKHFPIIAHINEAYNTDIIEFIESLTQGVGIGYDYTCGSFWNELDDFDKEQIECYDGLLVETDNEEQVIISYTDLYYYLNTALNRIADSATARDVQTRLAIFKDTYLK